MIIFTYFGGMEAVIWVEVVQLGIYLAGAAMAAVVLIMAIKGGWGQAISLGEQYHKFNFIDFGIRPTTYAFTAPFTSRTFNFTLPIDFTKTYTLWAGLLGGCFLTMSTHGTDQYLVQRYLCTDKPRRAALALLTSGAVVFAQFVGFLFIGVLLFAFYAPHTDPAYGKSCERRGDASGWRCVSGGWRRSRVSRLHHKVYAVGFIGAGGGRDFCCCAFVIA